MGAVRGLARAVRWCGRADLIGRIGRIGRIGLAVPRPVSGVGLLLPIFLMGVGLIGQPAHGQLADETRPGPLTGLSGELAPLSGVELLETPAPETMAGLAGLVDVPPNRFADPFAVDVSPATHGRWEMARDGRTAVWRFRVASAGAVSLNLGFKRYRMPSGGRLLVYAPDGSEIIGPFTDADNESHGELWTPLISGDEVVMEVSLPKSRVGDLELELKAVNRGFRELNGVASGSRGGDPTSVVSRHHGSCAIDVACSQGDGYRDQIRSVGQLVIAGTWTCTGTLLNNTARDGTPYFLTAAHCGFEGQFETPAVAAASAVVYWNYEKATCDSSESPSRTQSQTGAYLRALWDSTDFTLLELDDQPGAGDNVFFAGWDRDATSATSAINIGHADRNPKSLAVTNEDVVSGGGFLRVASWSEGGHGDGSSGGPLFDPSKRVIGQLSSANFNCLTADLPAILQPANPGVFFGRLGTSWVGGGTSGSRLSDWLDPGGTGETEIDGLDNLPPRSVGTMEPLSLGAGGSASSIDVSGLFEDPDEDALTFEASSSDETVATAEAADATVTVTPLSGGTATVTVTATDVAGSNRSATQTFDVRVKGRRGVTVSTGTLSVNEGSTMTYTVVLDSEPTGTVTVTPVVPANRNLSVDPTEVEFGTGDWQVEKSVIVEAATDSNTNSEPPVTISHRVSGADYGSVSASSVRVTIVEVGTSVLSVEAAAASESAGAVTFEVTLSRASTSEIMVDYATSNGSALAGSDYTAANGTLTFPASSVATQQIVVNITDDADDEAEEENFRLTLSNAQHASLAGGGSTLEVLGTIEDNDDPEVEVSFGSANYGVTEGRTVNVVVRLDRDPERDLEVFLDRAHHGGAENADYSGVPQSVAFGAGVRRQTFSVAATDDTFDDDGESVVLSFVGLPFGVSGDGETTIAIQDNDGSAPGGGGGGTGGGGGGGGPPPDDEEDDNEEDDDEEDDGDTPGGGGDGGGGGPPRAAVTTDADCAGTLCRARTGVQVSFQDASTGAVLSRQWNFGDGTTSASARLEHAWSSPGFYEVTLVVSDGTTTSAASRMFLVEASEPAGTCVSNAVRRCLQDSRYSVAVEWRKSDGEGGVGAVVHSGTNDSGLFTFFNRENWEMLIKVLNGCALNDHVWVFGASTTDLGYTLRVTDTVTGAVKEYRNEAGQPAPAITDVTAFPGGCAP